MDSDAPTHPALQPPLVTIGMPAYNGAPHVEDAVQSLLSQTESRFILTISDDCSTDETGSICRRLAAEDSRIRYVRQPVNQGSVRNYEYLFRLASTPFFMWAAQDDLWDASFVEVCLEQLSEAPSAVGCVTAGQRKSISGKTTYVYPPLSLSSPNAIRRVTAPGSAVPLAWPALYSLFRRDVIPVGALGLFQDLHGWDMIFIYRVALEAPFVIESRPLITYRQTVADYKTVGRDSHLWLHLHSPDQRDLFRGFRSCIRGSGLPLRERARLLLWANRQYLLGACRKQSLAAKRRLAKLKRRTRLPR